MCSDYPLLVAPYEFAGKSRREWTKREARTYMEWLLSVLEDRVAYLLAYLREDLSGSAEEVLRRVGTKAREELHKPAFSTPGEGERKLTNRGFSFAADIGLLFAKLIIQECAPRVSWTLYRERKSDLSYNCPVLVGFGIVPLDPLEISITAAFSVLAGSSGDRWAEVYRVWKNMIQ